MKTKILETGIRVLTLRNGKKIDLKVTKVQLSDEMGEMERSFWMERMNLAYLDLMGFRYD